MKTVVVVLACFLIFETTAGNVQPNAEHNLEKRWDLTDIKLPDLDICDTDEDCGQDRCCINVLGLCAPKRGLEQSRNFMHYHGCGCKKGLFCQVANCFGSFKYYQCLPAIQ
ncbi:uncharacterized protein [Montipora capricornis]|uniref:uncharacterized protein n=1 Tax=Montipora capricornis TaxID=246305 RepID=UPI0035F1EF5D